MINFRNMSICQIEAPSKKDFDHGSRTQKTSKKDSNHASGTLKTWLSHESRLNQFGQPGRVLTNFKSQNLRQLLTEL